MSSAASSRPARRRPPRSGRPAATPSVIPCNISDKAQCQNLIAETKKQLGPVDVLVCNAATNPYYGPTEKMPDEAFTKIMQNNILSATSG